MPAHWLRNCCLSPWEKGQETKSTFEAEAMEWREPDRFKNLEKVMGAQ